MVLLRRVIGDALRARRQAQHRTLREVSTAANVSLGYLSEIERGQKEASSELLAAICEALGAALSEVLRDVSDSLALAEDLPVLVPVGGGEDAPGSTAPAAPDPAPAAAPAAPEAKASVEGRRPAESKPGMADVKLAGVNLSDVKMSVAIHNHGPLKTTLRTTRPSRDRDVAYAG
jgi:transcriptional regulator with XRE-family HTH domain